jgi:hypothetical protein
VTVDQLEAWAVRGRIATAARKVRDTIARLATDSAELADALDEAEQLGLRTDALVAVGAELVR